MFLAFYQLRDQPFGATPDPRYLYYSPGHREALASLFYGIETGRGFLSLIAEPGMGKTTLLYQLLKRWQEHVHCAYLFQTQCNSREFLRYLLEDLGLESHNGDYVRMHAELNDFLFRETNAGKRVVVFIDEAQNLSDKVLETVRLLSNFEAPDKKMIQIVLAGQPELAQRLALPGMAQLRQRFGIQAKLSALPSGEVVRYINHRLQVAGYEGPGLFTAGALTVITERSRGIPRLINNLCFNALSLGCAMRRKQIDSEIVREAAADLSLDSQIPEPRVPQPPVQQRQSISARAPDLPVSMQFLYSRMKDNLVWKRVLQTSVLTVLLGSLAIYSGARSRAGAVTASPEIRRDVVSASNTPRPESPLAEAVVDNSGAAHHEQSPQTGPRESSRTSFCYVVQPKDTLRQLCLSAVGRYDHLVLTEIQRLNPELRNPDRIVVGQELQLPLDSPK